MNTDSPQKPSLPDALESIKKGLSQNMMVPHEERIRTNSEARQALWDRIDTVRDIARNAGFTWLIKPEFIKKRELELGIKPQATIE